MPQRKVTMYKTSIVAFKHLQVSLPNSGFRIVSLDRLYQVIYVRREGYFPSIILNFKIQLIGIGDKTTAIIQSEGIMSIVTKLWRRHTVKLLNELEKCLKES
jgi:hypothetical protein